MYRDTAEATRTCHICRVPILKGEEHYAQTIKSYWKFRGSRRNICMLCALQTEAKESAQKYLDEHTDIRNRMMLKRIQLGVALR
jgi:hypothetical protein